MDVFALGKALTRAPAYDEDDEEAKARNYREIGISKGVIFTIKSYGRQWKFVLSSTHLTAEYIPEGSTKGPLTDDRYCEQNFPSLETDQQLILCCCWMLVRDNWLLEYGRVAHWCPQIKMYNERLLRTLIQLTAWDKRWRSLYRPMCAMLHEKRFEIPCKGGYPYTLILSEDGQNMWFNVGRTDEEPDATFEWGCAVAFWSHLTQTYTDSESEGEDEDEE